MVEENGKHYDFVFWGGMGGIREPLVNNKEWPTLADEYADSLRRAKLLPCDIYTEPHAEGMGFLDKMNRLLKGAQPNPFYDPEGCRSGIERRERELKEQVEKERAAAR